MREPADDRTASRGGWLAWPLLALIALPMVVVMVVARRALTGGSSIYGELPGDLALRERAALLLQISGGDGQLLAPVLGLAVLAWLAHRAGSHQPPRAALWCGTGLAAVAALVAAAQCGLVGYLTVSEPTDGNVGLFGPQDAFLELFGPGAASALLLAALAGALAVGLASLARRQPAVDDRGLLDEDDPVEPQPVQPAPAPGDPEPVDVAEGDPHARYRRPD